MWMSPVLVVEFYAEAMRNSFGMRVQKVKVEHNKTGNAA